MATTFVLSDESLNDRGYRIITSGINLDRFKKNPIMLWMHRRDDGWDLTQVLPIGIWENIRIEDNKLLADAKFDDNDKFAQLIKVKVENGLIRACSIGINPVAFSSDPKHLIPGQTRATVTKSEMYEASLVDIPSNKNSVRLFSTHQEDSVPIINNNSMSGKNEEKQLSFTSEDDLMKFMKEKFGFEPKAQEESKGQDQEEFKLKSETSLLSWIKEKFGFEPKAKSSEETATAPNTEVETLKSENLKKEQEIEALKLQVENLKKAPGAIDKKTQEETDELKSTAGGDSFDVYASARKAWDAVSKMYE